LLDLDGDTVASRLRARPEIARIPIVFITGAEVPMPETLSHGLGAVYLKKPFTAAQLLWAVSQARRAF
jgi:CheY-like chemotaxis protein